MPREMKYHSIGKTRKRLSVSLALTCFVTASYSLAFAQSIEPPKTSLSSSAQSFQFQVSIVNGTNKPHTSEITAYDARWTPMNSRVLSETRIDMPPQSRRRVSLLAPFDGQISRTIHICHAFKGGENRACGTYTAHFSGTALTISSPQIAVAATIPFKQSLPRTAFNPARVDPILRSHQRIGVPYTIAGRKYHPVHDPAYNRLGIASWYGDKFHGRLTANGEVYNKDAMTAAHKTLPLNSYVYVTNVETGQSVQLRINDRGPFAGDRIIDLSEAAANTLGIKKSGLGLVSVQYAGPAPLHPKPPKGYKRPSKTAPIPRIKPGHNSAPINP